MKCYYSYVHLKNGMVWYSMVWYGMVWYGMVWYGMEFKACMSSVLLKIPRGDISS